MLLVIMFFILAIYSFNKISNYKEDLLKTMDYKKRLNSIELDTSFLDIIKFREKFIMFFGIMSFIVCIINIHVGGNIDLINNVFIFSTIIGFSGIAINFLNSLYYNFLNLF